MKDLREGRAIACLRCEPTRPADQEPPAEFIRPPQPDRPEAVEWLRNMHENRNAMRRLLNDVDRAVVRHLEERWGKDHPKFKSKRREATAAALRRLRFMTAEDIARHIRTGGEPPSRVLVHQWVCRGRRVVLSALDHWYRKTRSDQVRDQIQHLRDLMAAGRADAGKPRPWARKANELNK